jgi:hypothetical protein
MTLRTDLLTKLERADALAHIAAIKRMLAAPERKLVESRDEPGRDTFLDDPTRLPEE